MSTTPKAPESAMVRGVGAWLKADGWRCFYEVDCGGCRADIVASRLGELLIVEAKTALTFDVLAQAENWVRGNCAHRVAVAVPKLRRGAVGEGRRLAYSVAAGLGVGIVIYKAPSHGDDMPEVRWERAAPLRARANTSRLRGCLHAGVEANEPGKNRHYWTPFRDTMRQLEALVKKHPGISTKAAIAKLEHHYATDRSAYQCVLSAVRERLCAVELRDHGLYPIQT